MRLIGLVLAVFLVGTGCAPAPAPDLSVLTEQTSPEFLATQKRLWEQAVAKLKSTPSEPGFVLRSFSLAGDRLLWIREGEGSTELWSASLKDRVEPLTPPVKLLSRRFPEALLGVALSPDGKHALLQTQSAATEDPENRCSLELLELDSRQVRVLVTSGSRYLAPLWCTDDAFLLGECGADLVTVYRQTMSGERTELVRHAAPYARLVLQALEPGGWMLVDRNDPANGHYWLTADETALSGWTELRTLGQRTRPMGWFEGKLVVIERQSREQSLVRLESLPLQAPLRGPVLFSTGPIEYAYLSGSTLLFLTTRQWSHEMGRLNLRTRACVPVPMPFEPAHGAAFQPSGPGRALLPLQGPFQPPGLFLVTTEPLLLRPLILPELPELRRDDFLVEYPEGGIRIRPAEAGALERPVLLESYGAFGEQLPPVYDPLRLEWLRLGGEIALAQLREKPRGQDELVDRLLDAARAFPVVVYRGQSFGATLGLMAMQRDPGAFEAVLADAPLTDLLHFAERRPGELWLAEIGNPREPGERERLLALSPFHNLRGASYPPTVVTIAEGDPVVDWRHATAYVRRAQEAEPSNLNLLELQQVGAHDRLKPYLSEQMLLADLLWSLLPPSATQAFGPSR